MKASRPLAFVVLAFVVGATISQASFAFADDSSTNPFRAIWDAISELQTKTDSLQAQIDDLRETRGGAPAEQAAARISEPSVVLEVGTGQPGQMLIQVVARNAGPENAVGVKLSTYYQMSLLNVNFIEGAECSDQARGIIECYLGTLDAGSEARISINATPVSLGRQAVITADISSITEDANPANNHFEATFITSETPVVIPPPVQPEQVPGQQPPAAEQPVEQPPVEQPPVEQVPPAEQNEQTQQPQEEQQEQPPAEQPQEQPAENEQPAEQQSEPPAEQPAEQSASPPSEAPSSGSGSSGGESPPPPPPPSEGTTG